MVVLSIHWGGNWEYQVDKRHRKFAHAAIKSAGVDIIHGHSSHHARGIICANIIHLLLVKLLSGIFFCNFSNTFSL